MSVIERIAQLQAEQSAPSSKPSQPTHALSYEEEDRRKREEAKSANRLRIVKESGILDGLSEIKTELLDGKFPKVEIVLDLRDYDWTVKRPPCSIGPSRSASPEEKRSMSDQYGLRVGVVSLVWGNEFMIENGLIVPIEKEKKRFLLGNAKYFVADCSYIRCDTDNYENLVFYRNGLPHPSETDGYMWTAWGESIRESWGWCTKVPLESLKARKGQFVNSLLARSFLEAFTFKIDTSSKDYLYPDRFEGLGAGDWSQAPGQGHGS